MPPSRNSALSNCEAELTASERAAFKERSRAEDAKALATGRKTPAQLRDENSPFRRIAHEPIQWDKNKRLS